MKFPLSPDFYELVPLDLDDVHGSHDSLQGRALLLRCLVARTLTDRIFRPFLFTISRNQDKSDQLFKEVSQSLAQKSPEQEALWRQQISHAAYTAPNAQQGVNKTAASIVEEILDSMDRLMHVEERPKLVGAIRNIVKVAAETWRYARSVPLDMASRPFLFHFCVPVVDNCKG